MTLEKLTLLIVTEYQRIFLDWYRDRPDVKQASIIVELNQKDPGYSPERDEIMICVSPGDLLDETDIDANRWPAWKRALVHEMLHEYQFKVVRNNPSEAGIQLFNRYQIDERTAAVFNDVFGFAGIRHNQAFYTAIPLRYIFS